MAYVKNLVRRQAFFCIQYGLQIKKTLCDIVWVFQHVFKCYISSPFLHPFFSLFQIFIFSPYFLLELQNLPFPELAGVEMRTNRSLFGLVQMKLFSLGFFPVALCELDVEWKFAMQTS